MCVCVDTNQAGDQIYAEKELITKRCGQLQLSRENFSAISCGLYCNYIVHYNHVFYQTVVEALPDNKLGGGAGFPMSHL